MDDCRLRRLEVKPGRLDPVFQRDVTDYCVTVGSEVDSVTFNCETSDKGASYTIVGSSGGKLVKLKEGEVNKVKIEVTSEDGTTKLYWVQIRRLLAKDAVLSKLEVKGAEITPQFSSTVLKYYGLLPCNITNVEVVAVSDDSKSHVEINDGKLGSVVQLNVGQTDFGIKVSSPDGSNDQIYSVLLIRKQLPVFVRFSTPELAAKFECPVSLAPFYKPVTIKGSVPTHTYSGPIIENFVRTSKIDPISERPLDPDWNLPNYDLDQEMSQVSVIVPLINGGFSEKIKYSDLGNLIKNLIHPSKLKGDSQMFEKNCPLSHSIEVNLWEKQLQQHFDKDMEKLSDAMLEKYFDSLPGAGEALQVYADGKSPFDHLEQLASYFASAIKSKNKNPDFHLKLGMILEEILFLEDIFGMKKQKTTVAAGTDIEAQESSKAEECDAICRMYGVSKDSTLAAQLKAIDQEYHSLLEKGQSFKADHVQSLFTWKSKQGAMDHGSGNPKSETSLEKKAFIKYCDALSLDQTKAAHHFHVGRLLMNFGDYEKAIPRLEAAIGWNEKYDLARFYLGVALVLRQGGPGKRSRDALAFLHQGFQMLLSSVVVDALKSGTARINRLHAENLLQSTNVHFLQGLIQLGHLVKSVDSKECISATDVWHNVALMSSFALTVVARGKTYQKLEKVLMDVHWLLLQNLMVDSKDNTSLISSRCERLSAFIRHSTIPRTDEILQLQLKTSQALVQIEPCNSRALYLLGNAQLALYDFKPDAANAKELLNSSKDLFLASIALEGKPDVGEPLPAITGQKWWQEKISEVRKTSPPCSSTPGGQVAGTSSGTKLCEQRKSTAAKALPRGSTASKTVATSKGKMVTQGASSVQNREGKGGKTPTAKIPSKVVPGRPVLSKLNPPTSPSNPNTATQPDSKPEVKTDVLDNKISEKIAAINQPSYHPRLGLGRALSREVKDLSGAKKYYVEAIAMAPQKLSAYIEIAELIADKEPLEAVDIYSKLPVSENPTFDDAFVSGEIVRLLFKAEKYDDSRLLPNMVMLGKILGIASLEKYVEILQSKFKTDFLMKLYAGVNGKKVDDPMMQQFYKMKCWI